MPEILQIQSDDTNIEHEGKKTPIKGYDWDEIDDIDVDNPFEVKTLQEARRAHTLLHWAWDDRALPGWHYDEIIAEHARAVDVIIDKGERHALRSSLDTTLPDGLKERSIDPKKELTFVRSISDDHAESLKEAGVDTVRKLTNADAEELSEESGISLETIKYFKERAESF
ncbi:MAG: hypothetical protein ABEK50_08640 [bacterium]